MARRMIERIPRKPVVWLTGLRLTGGKARAIIYPDYGHQIPIEIRDKEIDPFIDGLLGK